MRGRRAPGAALALACLVLAGSASAQADDDLERLRRAIRDSRERVSRYEREQRGLLEAIEALDRATAALERDVARARRRAAEARAELEAIRAEAAALSRRLDATRLAMKGRAVALYKAGELGAVPMLFSAGGFREFLSRVSALRLLLGHDASLLERHASQTRALALAEAQAADASRRSEEAATRLRERSAELAVERETKRRVVARLHSDRAHERIALAELETAASALEETLSTLGGAPPPPEGPLPGPSFASLRGRLEPPVAAPIVREFGRVVDAEFRTRTFRRGVDFDAPSGAPVRAVAGGDVRFAGWFRGYGRIVILDHGDAYFSVSGHLAEVEVEVGERVGAGDVIGSVGDTGSLSGPRLYFEIRRGGEPEDPRGWLRPSKAG